MWVLTTDDLVLLREGLALILGDGGHEVIAAIGSRTELVPRALELRPELTITDIHMPPSNTDEGLRAAVEIHNCWGGAPILLLSRYVVVAYAQESLADGGTHLGYLPKDRVADIDTFLEAVDRVAGGGLVLGPEVAAQVLGRGRKADPATQLSPREREVLGLMVEGHTNADIVKRLVITEGVIEKHTQRISSKLGLHSDPGVHRRVKAVLTLPSSWSPSAGARELKKLEVRLQRSPTSP